MPYATEWASALQRTQRFGLSTPAFQRSTEKFITQDVLERFPYVVRDAFGELSFEEVVGQCVAIHHRVLPVIEEMLGCEVYFTLGWVDDRSERGMFRFDDAFIEERLSNPRIVFGEALNLHAWLTLPSLEVIDISLVTSIVVINKMKDGHGGVLAGPADSFNGFSYKPMLVGTDFLKKSGMLLEFG